MVHVTKIGATLAAVYYVNDNRNLIKIYKVIANPRTKYYWTISVARSNGLDNNLITEIRDRRKYNDKHS